MDSRVKDIELRLLGEEDQEDEKPSEQLHFKSHFIDYLSLKSSPEKYIQKPNFLKMLTFTDIFPSIRQLNQQTTFELKDVPRPDAYFNTERNVIELDYHWQKELQSNREPSLFNAIYNTYKKEWYTVLSLMFFDSTCKIAYTIYLGKFIRSITSSNLGGELDKDEIIISAIVVIVFNLLSFLPRNWYFFHIYSTAGRARLAITGFLYKKLNSISLTSLKELNLGKVINLIANDLNDASEGSVFVGAMVLMPYMMLLALYIMWQFFGFYCIFGILALVCCVTLQSFLAKLTELPRKEKSILTDERIKRVNEIIECIRLIKMYAWETPFLKLVETLREKEVAFMTKIVSIDALARSLSLISDHFAIFIICYFYTAAGGLLSPEKVYSAITILTYLSYTGILFFQQGRMYTVNLKIVLKRAEDILKIPDILTVEEASKTKQSTSRNNKELVFENFTGYWSRDARNPCLKNINLTIKPGKVTAIIGRVGSGKTSLLLSLMRELPVTMGKLNYSGSIAYVEQEPIIFSGTIRWNILFGRPYNESLYKQVIKACNLETDLALFEDGDLTLIGERGVNLSGGQKARVSLARALYSQSDIYLLDDPISALDAKVARNIFDKVIKGDLMKDKIILLVTHHLNFAKESDYVIVMNNGEVEAEGRFKDLEKMGIDLLSIFQSDSRKASALSLNDDAEKEEEKKKDVISKKEAKELKEESVTISWATYKAYCTTIGTWKDAIIGAILFLGFQGVVIYYGRFLGHWAQMHVEHSVNQPVETFDHGPYVRSCIIMLLLIFVISYFRRIFVTRFLLLTNSELHSRMLKALVRAKVLFFDQNPIGRIINRFSNDLGVLDKQNLITFFDCIDGTIMNGSLLLTVCVINPQIVLPSVLIAYLLYKVKLYFTKPMVEVKKLDLTSRSPLFSMVSSTINGLMIIRIFQQGGNFIREFMDKIYQNSKAFVFMNKSNRLFGMMLDAGITAITILGIIGFTILVFQVSFESSLVGLSLVYLIQLGQESSYVIRQTLLFDIIMQSAQRIVDYCKLESEAPASIPEKDREIDRPRRWPFNGEIVFNNVFLRYTKDSNYALQGLSFNIPGGCKVGVVGRTGAGKSSIIQTLLRMNEIESGPGFENSFIKIDGVDIREIGLSLLRSRLSIIPQNPTIFTGTIRRNLDPFEEYSDAQLWKALEEVHLKDYVMSLDKQLNTDMTISSSVFSTGQKQLLCLARAILTRAKILILDEATANVDVETDKFIQDKIIEKFGECTILTIAHRLITIAHYDKVLSMKEGRLEEFDSPYKLLVENEGDDEITKKSGLFAEMVLSTGKSMSKKIFKIAKENYERTKKSLYK